MKRCSKCGVEKADEDFYACGGACKDCRRAYARVNRRRYYAEHGDQVREYARGYSRRKYHSMTPADRVARNAYSRDYRRERSPTWHLNQARKQWAAAHPELAALIERELQRAMVAAWFQRRLRKPGVRQQRSAAAAGWRIRNRSKYRKYLRAWKRANPERMAVYDARRVAHIVGVEQDPAVEAFYLMVRTAPRLRCYLCGRIVPKKKRHVDHVVPLSLGGLHAVENLACACASCNLAKKDKPPGAMGFLPFVGGKTARDGGTAT